MEHLYRELYTTVVRSHMLLVLHVVLIRVASYSDYTPEEKWPGYEAKMREGPEDSL